ncbi:hypothetical protein [Candidatus Uabimicrobium sp. HlEnr_7]|uniref:hypothetical protein n=1 Tax=Candidatus Uabimicrobium helgolandensis TaxID=3095367 RepID=UPI0035563247
MPKKITKGQGWTFVSADSENCDQSKVVSLSPGEQQIKIFLAKRKKGKIVTIIDNLVLKEKELKSLGKKLKVACGVGGTTTKSHIELQGDCCEKAKIWLQKNNWGVN